jgi:predicted Zn-ribbon and HTH transcriptional regulator
MSLDTPYYVVCEACGHKHEIVLIPTRCPRCGSGRSAAQPKTDAEKKTEAVEAKFRIASERAKGNF